MDCAHAPWVVTVSTPTARVILMNPCALPPLCSAPYSTDRDGLLGLVERASLRQRRGFHCTGSRVESRGGRSHVWSMTFGLRGQDYRVPAEARTLLPATSCRQQPRPAEKTAVPLPAHPSVEPARRRVSRGRAGEPYCLVACPQVCHGCHTPPSRASTARTRRGGRGCASLGSL